MTIEHRKGQQEYARRNLDKPADCPNVSSDRMVLDKRFTHNVALEYIGIFKSLNLYWDSNETTAGGICNIKTRILKRCLFSLTENACKVMNT